MYIPTSLLSPVKIVRGSPQRGLLWPFNKKIGPMMIFPWEGESHAIYFEEGPNYFKVTALQMTSRVAGLFIRDFSFVADITSAYDASKHTHPRGALILKDGEHSLAASHLDDRHADLIDVPVDSASRDSNDTEAIGFASWKIIASEGDNEFQLWHQKCEPLEE